MVSKILRLRSVIELTGLSRNTIYLQISQGTFPKQVSLGARAVSWRESDIVAWLDQLLEK